MDKAQYLSRPNINGKHIPEKPDINPRGEGVNFTSTQALITIDIQPSIAPIIESVSIANKAITNVLKLIVSLITPDGSGDMTLSSPVGDPSVIGFPAEPLPPYSTLFIIFETIDGKAPYGITLSIIGCYHPEKKATSTSPYSTHSSTRSKARSYSIFLSKRSF